MVAMKAARVTKPGAGFQIVERNIPGPVARHVRIKVQASGVCHSRYIELQRFFGAA
jgi:D-arabinose 1-dehydrogenase-like Zn-dependent alcohol dehydrogenase